jgi:K+ transporter
LNYFGQGVWILNHPHYHAASGDLNPFFTIWTHSSPWSLAAGGCLALF